MKRLLCLYQHKWFEIEEKKFSCLKCEASKDMEKDFIKFTNREGYCYRINLKDKK